MRFAADFGSKFSKIFRSAFEIVQDRTEIRSDRGRIWTHPVVVNGKLYLRDQDMIYCYDIKR